MSLQIKIFGPQEPFESQLKRGKWLWVIDRKDIVARRIGKWNGSNKATEMKKTKDDMEEDCRERVWRDKSSPKRELRE